MSKIGDLFVRLGLKKDEFSKGLKDAKKESSSFVDSLKNIGSKGKIAFAAVAAAVVAVGSAIKSLAKQNQSLGDEIRKTGASLSAMWDTVKTSIAALDFSNLIGNLREANRLARDLYDAQDALGEIGTSYNISLAQQMQHINELKLALRDQSLTDDERIAKGEELLRIYEALERNPTRGLERAKDTTLDYYMQRMGVQMEGRSDAELASMRKQFVEFFKWLGTAQGESYNNAAKKVAQTMGNIDSRLGQRFLTNAAAQGRADFARLAVAYNDKMGDKDREKLEQAVTAYYQQQAKYSGETLRIQTQINSLKAKDTGGPGGSTAQPEDPRLKEAERIQQRLESFNKSELQQLKEKYDREKALMEELGMDTTVLAQEYAANVKKIIDVPLSAAKEMDDIVVDIDFELDMEDDPVAEFIDKWEKDTERMQEVVSEFRGAAIQGFSDAVQELANQFFGLEEINPGKVVQALLTPLADMAIKEGEILIAEGIGVEACKKALESLNGYAAIAAGMTLVGIGAAAKAGLKALAGGASTGAGATSAAAAGSGGSYSNVEDRTELTIYVRGKLDGGDIVLSGEQTLDKWGR